MEHHTTHIEHVERFHWNVFKPIQCEDGKRYFGVYYDIYYDGDFTYRYKSLNHLLNKMIKDTIDRIKMYNVN